MMIFMGPWSLWKRASSYEHVIMKRNRSHTKIRQKARLEQSLQRWFDMQQTWIIRNESVDSESKKFSFNWYETTRPLFIKAHIPIYKGYHTMWHLGIICMWCLQRIPSVSCDVKWKKSSCKIWFHWDNNFCSWKYQKYLSLLTRDLSRNHWHKEYVSQWIYTYI